MKVLIHFGQKCYTLIFSVPAFSGHSGLVCLAEGWRGRHLATRGARSPHELNPSQDLRLPFIQYLDGMNSRVGD